MAERTTTMSKEKSIPIVINRMFTGDKYLNDSGNENIGHEIINLFRADDKNNYIYFCDSGKYNSSEYQLPKYSFLHILKSHLVNNH